MEKQTHKTCNYCSTEKPIQKFGKKLGYKDGRRNQCNSCRSFFTRQYKLRKDYTAGSKQIVICSDCGKFMKRRYQKEVCVICEKN